MDGGVGRRLLIKREELPELLSIVSDPLDRFEDDGEEDAEMLGDLFGSGVAFSTCFSCRIRALSSESSDFGSGPERLTKNANIGH